MELFGATIGNQVAEHQVNLQAKLSGGELVFCEVDFDAEMTDVVKFNFLFLIADHKTSGFERVLLVLDGARENVVVVLSFLRLFLLGLLLL